MASESYSARALVLRKTVMGESDLALSLLAEDGSKLRCVAKGARKPSNTFSSRLELYSEVEIHCVKGRSLDIIKEARLINPHAALRTDIAYNTCAAPIAELLDAVSQEDLDAPQLFPMASSAFTHIEHLEPQKALAICAAQLLKTLSVIGFRPSLNRCVHCGNPIDLHAHVPEIALSDIDGGAVCDNCTVFGETRRIARPCAAWVHAFIGMTFDDIAACDIDVATTFETLMFAHQWTRVHVGKTLKSMNFLLTSGLF